MTLISFIQARPQVTFGVIYLMNKSLSFFYVCYGPIWPCVFMRAFNPTQNVFRLSRPLYVLLAISPGLVGIPYLFMVIDKPNQVSMTI